MEHYKTITIYSWITIRDTTRTKYYLSKQELLRKQFPSYRNDSDIWLSGYFTHGFSAMLGIYLKPTHRLRRSDRHFCKAGILKKSLLPRLGKVQQLLFFVSCRPVWTAHCWQSRQGQFLSQMACFCHKEIKLLMEVFQWLSSSLK